MWAGATALGIASILLISPVQAVQDLDDTAGGAQTAGRPGPHELSRSALEGILRESDPQVIGDQVRQASRTVAERAEQAPSRFGSASVVFTTGLSTRQAATFVSHRDLDLLTAEAKTPVGESGKVYTQWFSDFERYDGSVAERLERAVGKARFRFFQQANEASGQQRKELREVAGGDVRFYRLELVGPNSSFAALLRDPSVAAVLPAPDARKVKAFQERRAKLRAMAKKAEPARELPEVRLSSGDPLRGKVDRGEPVITNSGLRCVWLKGEAILDCRAGSKAIVAGNPALGRTLPRSEGDAVAGTTAESPSKLGDQGTVRPQQDDYYPWIACNSAAAPNEGCPNDHTYRPHSDTGGQQAWAAAMASFEEGTHLIVECTATWVEDEGGHWETVCYVYEVRLPAFTIGAAEWYSGWGTRTARVPSLNQNVLISTLAFQDPRFSQCAVRTNQATAWCDDAVGDVTYVPNPGIEDELLLPNPACVRNLRSGDESDWDEGCFWPTYAVTTLPSPFLDTTFGDIVLIDNPEEPSYNLAVGSSQPTQIVEGELYGHYAEFFALDTNNVVGRPAWHAVSVDSRIGSSVACQTYGTPAFCYFPVDSSRVSEKIRFQ